MTPPSPPRPAHNRLGQTEFVALMAMLAATVALAIDGMLPALGEMGEDLSPANPDLAALTIMAFVSGMGFGTFFSGPLSDAYGRRPVLLSGAGIFILGAAACAFAQDLTALIIARFIQGLGASGPRVVAMAVIRDRYKGREMARMLSFVMVVFAIVPVLAPSLGALIMLFSGWRGIFWAFAAFSMATSLWFYIRQGETLIEEDRRPISVTLIWSGLKEMLGIEMVRLSIIVQTLAFAMLFGLLASIQFVYDQTFDRAESFPVWFGAVALVSASSGFLNASLVRRYGMRAIITGMFAFSTVASLTMAMSWPSLEGDMAFAAFLLWQTVIFFQAGMTIGNLNALALEPVGHIAGLAASVVAAVATIVAAGLAIPLSLVFDGTPRPMAFGLALFALMALLLTLKMRQLERFVVNAPVD
ncbi:MAG: multidrug effflux MFS transporter [Marinovum sp.]|nr:multidrug effflux MFS transporter [Marinovum sp.]